MTIKIIEPVYVWYRNELNPSFLLTLDGAMQLSTVTYNLYCRTTTNDDTTTKLWPVFRHTTDDLGLLEVDTAQILNYPSDAIDGPDLLSLVAQLLTPAERAIFLDPPPAGITPPQPNLGDALRSRQQIGNFLPGDFFVQLLGGLTIVQGLTESPWIVDREGAIAAGFDLENPA